jgi:hypothetical protein
VKLLRNARERFSIFREFGRLLRRHRLWWLAPVLVILLLFVVLIALTQSSAIAPFIYALF